MTRTETQRKAAEVIESSVDGSDPGKYEVASATGLPMDLVDRVLASYASWLRGDDDELEPHYDSSIPDRGRDG